MQYLVVLVATLTIFALVGLKRGWLGQVLTFVPILSLWGVFNLKGDALISLVNATYRGIRFFALCGTEEDTAACLQASGVMQAVLVNPDSPGQRRLLFLVASAVTILVAFTLVARFGKPPHSILQRLAGAVIGVANGFILSYLVLPLAPLQEQTAIPLAATMVREDSAHTVGPASPLTAVFQAAGPFLLVILIVLFVVVAVRFIRPTGVES